MNTILKKFPALVACTLICSNAIAYYTEPLRVQPGTTWEYRLDKENAKRPEQTVSHEMIVESALFRAGPAIQLNNKTFQWFEILFRRNNGQTYSAKLLLDSWPSPENTPSVARYLWQEPGWENPVEYINELTGKAELPRKNLWKLGWPQNAEDKSPTSFVKAPKRIFLHGWPFELVKTKKDAFSWPEENPLKIALNPDVMIASTGVHLDQEGRHEDYTGRKYIFVTSRHEEDWLADIAAGINVMIRDGQHKIGNWIWRTNCYVVELYVLPEEWPAQLYRSNYYGRAMYVDEPCIRIRSQFQPNTDQNTPSKITPEGAVRLLRSKIKEQLYNEGSNYNISALESWVDKVFGKGNLDLKEDHIASIEAIWQTAWYQLAVDEIKAFWDEWFYPDQLVERYNMAFGTQIPATIENACTIYVAIVRGASRNFGKPWGTWLYLPTKNQLNPKIYTSAIRYLYNAGATFFGHWYGWPTIGDEGYSIVPYSYRRANAANIRQIAKENPNRDLEALQRAADICVTIPEGYTFTPGPMFGIKALPLEKKNQAGVTYRTILGNAAREVERLIRSGKKFDIAVNGEDFKPEGYQEIIHCKEDGTVLITRKGQPDETLPTAREPDRPDLGPNWQIDIKIKELPSSTPGRVHLQAVLKEGTGELAKAPYHFGKNFIHWEVIDPHGYSSYNLSQNAKDAENIFEGEQCTFEARFNGDYFVRVAAVDDFGRPSIKEMILKIGPEFNQ